MPVKEYQCTEYNELRDILQNLEGDNQEVFVFFTCTLDKHGDTTAKCCFEAEDAVMEFTEYMVKRRMVHLIYFRRLFEDYYSVDSELRKDQDLHVEMVPTLLKWKGYQRLSGKQCSKIPLLSMLFEEECHNKFPTYQSCTYFKIKEEKPQSNEQLQEGETDHPIGTQEEQADQPLEAIEPTNPSAPSGVQAEERLNNPSADKIS